MTIPGDADADDARLRGADARRAGVRRAALRRAVPAVVVTLVGLVVLFLAGGDFAAVVVGSVLLGLGGIALVALAFYEVGLSEDRERSADP